MTGLDNEQSVEFIEENPNEQQIPFVRSGSTFLENDRTDAVKRKKIRQFFDRIDIDHNGYLNISEVKQLLRMQPCNSMPKGLAKQILQMADHDNDGQLDFEEFYRMSQQHEWLVMGSFVKYCQMVVPSPNREDDTDGDYERSMKCCPPPLTMIIFSILEIITFSIDAIIYKQNNPNSEKPVGVSTSELLAKALIYNTYRRYEVWRFATYMFVHVGIMHISMNLIIQILLGIALEMVHSSWRVTLIYMSGVVAGSIGTSLTNPKVFLAGASGGVYALITAHISTIIMNWSEMKYAVAQLFIFLVFCTSDVGLSIVRYHTDPRNQVGYVSHFCGAMAGLLVGIGVLRNLKIRPWERKLWFCAVTLYIVLMVGGICFHFVNPQYFPNQQYS